LHYTSIIEGTGFENLVVSLKSSNVLRTIEAYRHFSAVSDFPLHLGVTEAGTKELGTIRSAVGIGTLLAEGIGDTIRVSLTDDPVVEIPVAREIMACLGLIRDSLRVISCPTCSRTSADLVAIAVMIEKELQDLSCCPINVAVMGCPVNGPGEAREADVGIALAGGRAVLFHREMPEKVMDINEAVQELLSECRRLCDQRRGQGGGRS
jgi:(E)-4-hydroxy-3-methylbut-2-enyl-diphosphate synthase